MSKLLNLSMTTRSLEANSVISSSILTTCYMIRVTVNWIVAKVTRLPSQPEAQSHKVILW